MARTPPSAVPPKMYRHFALVTVLLTTSVAMFAEGENREVAESRIEQGEERQAVQRDDTEVARPPVAHRPAESRKRSYEGPGFGGFDPTFGAPMDNPLTSLAANAADVASAVAQTGYSDKYLAALDAEKRALLVAELEKEGLGSPEERERKTAALIAASEARSGTPTANY